MAKWTIEDSNCEKVENTIPEVGQAWRCKGEPNGKIYIRVSDSVGERYCFGFSPTTEMCSFGENGKIYTNLKSGHNFELVDMKFSRHCNHINPPNWIPVFYTPLQT